MISLTKATFIIAAQSPTGETGGGGGGGGWTIGFLPCCLNIKQYIENINNLYIDSPSDPLVVKYISDEELFRLARPCTYNFFYIF